MTSTLTDRLRGIVKATRLAPPAAEDQPDERQRATLSRVPAEPAVTGSGEAPAASTARSQDARSPGHTPHSLEAALGGAWVEAGAARSFIVERREDREAWHGKVQVGALAAALSEAHPDAALLVTSEASASPPFVFFDLETTGLSGGAGTYAFLVGCGWFDADGGFVMRQFVLPRAADERPMLRAVAAQFAQAGTLVSFNGKSFDAPLLETRFSYHRLPWTAGHLPHLDVLHPARRFWRSETPQGEASSCSLGSLERHVLGAHRLADLPGAEAPGRYFQFVRSGDARPLADVLEHNRNDILSLAGLTVRLLQLVRAGAGESRDAREAIALGRLYERGGMPGRAAEAFVHALTLTTGTPQDARTGCSRALLRTEALHALALGARRDRRYDEAAARWREIVEQPRVPPGILREALEALAIHHEHRVRDLSTALAFARRTLDAGPIAARRDSLRHRLARIERKLGVSQEHLRLQLGD